MVGSRESEKSRPNNVEVPRTLSNMERDDITSGGGQEERKSAGLDATINARAVSGASLHNEE